MMMYDMVIIGGGPAGISAGIYGVSRGKSVLVIEQKEVGGVIATVSTVTHYAGIISGETGKTFADRLKAQAEAAGVKMISQKVIKTKLAGEIKEITTDQGLYQARTVILANGTTPRRLGIPGEQELSGKGTGLNAARDGWRYEGKNIYVVGGADGAIKEALYLAQFAKRLTIIHFEEKLGCIAEFARKVEQTANIQVMTKTRLTAVFGQEQVEALELTHEETGEKTRIEDPGCGVFIYAGSTPNTELYDELELRDGFIPVNERMETEIPGIYAAGDIRVKQVRQAATAVADGAIAAINAASFLG